MSYLHALRLHFAGQFQAAVSTVNNDPLHFDNSTFLPEYQDLQTATADNGWFNPRGDASWRLMGCAVTGAWLGAGQPVAGDDPVLTAVVADSDRDVVAKLVDLDPEQQLVSTIFGFEVRIATAAGTTLLRGRFAPVAFTDIWRRSQTPSQGDTAAGATYQSVLTDLTWGDVSDSPFLRALREASADGLLSIKFNIDSFNLTFTSPDFMRGRIVGTIGPATVDEPRHLVLGRHFLTTSMGPGFFRPVGGLNFCVARVDEAARKIYLDLGNAVPTGDGGTFVDLGALTLAYLRQTNQGPRPVRIDTLASEAYTAQSWYPNTAGVVELPAGRELTPEELTLIAGNPLAIVATTAGGANTVAIAEPPTGEYLRADQFVHRMSPGDGVFARLYATVLGRPYAGARIITLFDPTQLQPGGGAPDVATPVEAVEYPPLITADERGIALLPIKVADPGNPRGYIDGQVYGLRPVLEDTVFSPGTPYPFNPSDFISVLVWDEFHPVGDPVTWFPSLQPVLQQFENLYPVMKRFVRLGDYDSVCANQRDLVYVFGLLRSDPNYMPVTRDLSPAKQAAILKWLTNLGADGKPLKGMPPPAPPPEPQPTPSAALAAPAPLASTGAERGGKAAAFDRQGARSRPSAVHAGTTIGGIE